VLRVCNEDVLHDVDAVIATILAALPAPPHPSRSPRPAPRGGGPGG
jgi:very-short-patch-repair endonuclease